MKRTITLGFAAMMIATALSFGTAQQSEAKSLRSIINSAINSVDNRYGYNRYGYGNRYYGYGYGNPYYSNYNPYNGYNPYYGYNNYGRRSVSGYLNQFLGGWY